MPAVLPVDQESLARAEADGKLSRLPAGWHVDPRASLANLGASADPRIGYALAALNETSFRARLGKCLGQCLDHDGPGHRLLHGLDGEADPTRLVAVHFCCSAVGGMHGAALRLARHVKEDGRTFGIRAETVFDLLLAGDLAVNHDQRVNETNMLRYLRAVLSGQYVDPASGELASGPDFLLLESNRNCHGRLSSLERLISHEAHCHNILVNSPVVSPPIQERLVDIRNWDHDRHGDPLAGFTMSTSQIRRDGTRIAGYLVNRMVSLLAAALVPGPAPADAKSKALALARAHGVVEAQDDSRLTARLLSPGELKGEDLLQRLRSSLSDRTEGTLGLDRASVLAGAIHTVSSVDFPDTFEPAMVRQAEAILQQTIDRLDSCIRQELSAGPGSGDDEKGLLDVVYLLSSYRRAIQASRELILEKIGQIQQFARPHEDVVNAALAQLEQVREHSWLWRLFNPFLAGRIAESLETSGRVVLESELQLRACRVAADTLLGKLIDFLDGRLAELEMLGQNLRQAFASCKQQAEGWALKSTIADVPLGIDLATRSFLDETFGRIVAGGGGEEAFVKALVTRFLSTYQSFSHLLGKPPDEITGILRGVCQAAYESAAGDADVATEFRSRYPDERTQLRFFRQLIRQSEGRILTVGETGREIVWLKFLMVPRSDDVEWAKALIEKADPKPGPWKVIVDGDPDAISAIQIRGGISLSSLIARSELDGPDVWEKMVARAIDPVTAMMVPPNPDGRPLHLVLAKALVTDQLQYDEATGFSLRFADQELISLGREPRDAAESLRHWWPWIVGIESTFGRHVVLDDQAVARRIERLEAGRTSSPEHRDPCLALIDDTTIADLRRQLDLLRPWAHRLRAAIENRGRQNL